MQPVIRFALVIRSYLVKLTSLLEWFPPLLARITIAGVFVQTGWGKLHHLDKVVEFFTQLGIPAPQFQAPFVAANEFVCGSLLLVGLFTRLASVPLAISMVVALITAKASDIHDMSDLFGQSEYLYIVVLVWLFFRGAGCLSLDAWLAKKFGAKS
jgi:putative oxidoreductase